MHYFAYGSNMSERQMRQRCPDSKLIGVGILKDYVLGFTIYSPKRECGCADVLAKAGSEVWGLLYEVSDLDIQRLDIAEAVPDAYSRMTLTVLDCDGNAGEAEVYKVSRPRAEFIAPSRQYMALLRDAAREHGFPIEYQDMLSDIPASD